MRTMAHKRRNTILAVSGKGGVGKTTISALILKYLTLKRPLPNILVLDVDPDTNMPDVLGMRVDRAHTVGGIAHELREQIKKGKLKPNFNKASYLESKTFEIMIEEEEFDMIVMSKSEGTGCYCFINSAMSGIIDTLQDGYHYVVIDTAAGLEHFSRRTMKDLDHLFIVTDPSKMGLKTAKRIITMTTELEISVGNVHIIGNRFTPENESILRKYFENEGENVDVLGILPQDPEIQRLNLMGKSLLEIPIDNPLYQGIHDFMKLVNL
ncbi:AAA family ATPase [Candidatus Bathyarchaeota archaeon]|nr:AAA family ATPase [Candidatus Bathyarchaeota archaeon]